MINEHVDHFKWYSLRSRLRMPKFSLPRLSLVKPATQAILFLLKFLFNLLSTFYNNYVAVDIYVFLFLSWKILQLFIWLMSIKIWEEILTNIKTLSYYQFEKQYKRILLNSQGNYV